LDAADFYAAFIFLSAVQKSAYCHIFGAAQNYLDKNAAQNVSFN